MNKKRLAGLAGLIVIGAIGSGVWELAKPALTVLSSISLTIVTLGLDTLRDGIYQEAARGLEETSARTLLISLSAFAFGLSLGMLTSKRLVRLLGGKHPETSQSATPAGEDPKKSHADRMYRRLAAVLISVSIIMMLVATRQAYVTTCTASYYQLEAITAPDLKEAERLAFRSRFAQMTTRADYISLVNELTAIAIQHKKKHPKITIF